MAFVLGQKFQKHRAFDPDLLIRDLQQMVIELQAELKARDVTIAAQGVTIATHTTQINSILARLTAAGIP